MEVVTSSCFRRFPSFWAFLITHGPGGCTYSVKLAALSLWGWGCIFMVWTKIHLKSRNLEKSELDMSGASLSMVTLIDTACLRRWLHCMLLFKQGKNEFPHAISYAYDSMTSNYGLQPQPMIKLRTSVKKQKRLGVEKIKKPKIV